MQNTIDDTTNVKFSLGNYEINLERKFAPKHKTQYNVLFLAHKVDRLHKQIGDDAFNWNKYKDTKYKNCSFIDFCEIISNLDKYANEFNEYARNEVKKLHGITNTYQLVNIPKINLRIRNNSNPYQKYYDFLGIRYFLWYEHYLHLKENKALKFQNLQEIPLKKEEKKFYFKKVWEFIELINNPILSDNEKQEILNKQYTSTKHLKDGTKVLCDIIYKANWLTDIIPEEDQKILIKKYVEQCQNNPLKIFNRLK